MFAVRSDSLDCCGSSLRQAFVSAAVGVLQVYYPDVFLPPEFSALARSLNPAIVDALSYVGPDGRSIIRPPGLSDLPGGAAVAGLTTVVLGIAYIGHEGHHRLVRIFSVGAVAVGMTALYLTQVRALTVMAAVGVLVFAAVRLRQGRILQGGWIAVGGAALVAASFMWAAAIGGKAIEDRFSGLIETGLLDTYQQTRGLFLEYTLRELLFRFPLGAGLGRWGMMQVYFSGSVHVARTAHPCRDSDHRLAARRRGPDVAVLWRRPCVGRPTGVRVCRQSFD